MRPFDYQRPARAAEAVQAASANSMYHAGGTTVVDLMKLDVWRPDRLIDISGLSDTSYDFVQRKDGRLRIGALTRMSSLADNAMIRSDYPLLSDSLWLAASPQLRNMARLGGNVLQRTRCPYYRDTSYDQCNRRNPGSGCAALDGGVTRNHAVLGVSDQCIATYQGDWAQALIALDANVELLGKDGPRAIRFADLHRLPGENPAQENNLRTGDLITAFSIPDKTWKRSKYLKIRDRESYAYALASAAVALDMDGDTVRDVRIGLGGVATVPWRASEAEAALKGQTLDEASATRAAQIAFSRAQGTQENAFKIKLGRETLVRALLETAQMEG